MRFVLLLVVAIAAAIMLAIPLSAAPTASVPRLAHTVLIVFENHERSDILGSGAAPTFEQLASTYAQATADYAVAHPSLPNYLALVSGSTHGVTSDCTNCPQPGQTIGSQLSAKHRPWAAYAEGYPSSSRFAKKHLPFLYFPRSASHVLPLQRFNPRKLPAYALVIPDLCNDMHDCSVATGDHWLRNFIAPILTVKDTAIFIVFDEGTSNAGGGGNVALIVAGTAVRRHSVFKAATSHYGLLRTIESGLGLPLLGHAGTATPLTGIWH
jgi:acid phosphatase